MENREPFLVLILDEDKKIFTIAGPLLDDTDLNHRVADAQKNGRAVRIYGALNAQKSRDEIIADARMRLRYAYVDDSIV